MSVNNINATALSDFSSLSPSIVASLWDKAMQDGVIENEWLSRFQGDENSSMPIIEKQDLAKGGGDTINFTVGSEIVGDGVKGDTVLEGSEEKLNLSTYQVVIDFVRHATAVNKRFKSFSAARRKLELTKLMSRWAARYKQMEALLRLRNSGAHTASGIANNVLWAGGGSSDASLTPSNGLDTGVFQLARPKLIALGAKPANISREEGYEVPMFVMWATTDALTNLNNDSAWNQASLMARPREGGRDAQNPLFTGCFSGKTYNGITPYEYMLPDHDNAKNGAIGSPLQPRALLRTATADASATAINGGGSSATSSAIFFFRDFPGFDFPFTSGQSATVDATVYYAKIKNLPGSTQAGKYEIISYVGSTGNNGNVLSPVTRNVNPSANTTVVHDANSIIVPCNADGVEYAYVIIAGAWALLRAYGESREQLQAQDQDYTFKNGVGIEAVFGQTPAQRRDGKFPNFVVAKVALT